MIKLAIDLGSSMTKIYRADTNSGIVLAEPSCVAVCDDTQEIKAVGKAAKNLIGKTAEYTRIVNPIKEGLIVDRPIAAKMLCEFLSRIGIKKSALRHALIVVSIPCGLGDAQLSEYVALMDECDLRKVRFVEQPYLAALGGGAVLSETDPIFCLDIGGGMSNAAVISANGIIAGIALNVGGNHIDNHIINKLANDSKLLIGALTAEKIKNEIGSLAISPLGSMVAEGSSTQNCQPDSTAVHATDLSESIRACINKILDYAVGVLWNLPAEVAAAVHHNGVYLSGGVMKLAQAPQYIGNKLNMRYHICEEPQFATVLGGGVLLQDKELLNRFARKVDM
ncbi:MAG: rod shape-determining protein [Clostridia bacterium]|nr:rod shape-determining protein [Clostridia bacterium]